jgi:hypothetical protein
MCFKINFKIFGLKSCNIEYISRKVTDYRLDDQTSNPERGRILLFDTKSIPILEPNKSLIQYVPVSLF